MNRYQEALRVLQEVSHSQRVVVPEADLLGIELTEANEPIVARVREAAKVLSQHRARRITSGHQATRWTWTLMVFLPPHDVAVSFHMAHELRFVTIEIRKIS